MNLFNLRFDEAFNLGPYNRNLKCYPVIMMSGKERHDVDKGGKIILPASALDHLTRLHIQFPMLFKLVNKAKNRTTHCGVLEFVAEEGRCYLPYWMMKNLLVTEGDLVQVEYISLLTAKFVKFQPQSVDFLEISNPKAVLENSLRNFATLTKGDTISINYNDKDYELCILETRPGEAVSIIECDMDVDFAAPVGYEEPTSNKKSSTSQFATSSKGSSKSLYGDASGKDVNKSEGYRLDGKSKRTPPADYNKPQTSMQANAADRSSSSANLNSDVKKGIPIYDYKIGFIRFHHDFDNFNSSMDTEEEPVKKPEPQGQKLKHIGVKNKS